MTHFLAMVLFSVLVSIAMAVLSPDHPLLEQKIKYGLKVFGYFVGIGFLIAWGLYFLPL